MSGAFRKAEGALRRYFAADHIPGLATAAVVLRKSLAYATIAQLPAQAGLFSALVPMAIYAVLGVIGAVPAGGGTPQTSVALNAGSSVQATWLVVAAAGAGDAALPAPVLALMPHATLAAVVIAYSIGLVDFAGMAAIRKVRSIEFHWPVVAFIGVMTLGALKGVVAAIVLSMGSLIRLTNDPRVTLSPWRRQRRRSRSSSDVAWEPGKPTGRWFIRDSPHIPTRPPQVAPFA